MNSSRNEQSCIDCFYSVISMKFSFFFTINTLLLYVVNDIIYIFGAKYVSFKRVLIEFLMEGIYCIILNYQLIDNKMDFNIFLIIIIFLDMFYYVTGSYFYHEDEEGKNEYIISKKIFQVLAVIIIMMEIYELILNSFDYHYSIQTLLCLLPAVHLLIEPLI